jgi:myosin-6
VPTSRKSKEQVKKGSLKDSLQDDYNNFFSVDKDLKGLEMSDSDRLSVYTTIASVLHLGNIDFEDDPDDNRGGCRVTESAEKSLQITASLMGLDPDELRRALTARVMQAAKGGYKGTVIMVPLKVHEASNARDALAKAIYSRLFDHIVGRINESIPFQESAYYIGVLDIAGFEYFTVNSFEQFCINYCNEKLQQFFNQRILKDEQDLYEKEGLGVKKISFVDNQDCIDLIESKGNGIFGLLDEESKLPKPNHQHFTEAVHAHNSSHFRLALPRKSKLREHREIHDDDGFLIRHFAGAVCYTLAGECQNEFIRHLFASDSQQGPSQKGKLTFISVGNKFQKQLGELMEKLRSTGTNFIRCIKPNVKMVAHLFEGGSILSQLQCAGMTSVLELMQQGYPSRTAFSELYNMYKKYLPPELARLDPRLFCKALFKALGLDDNDFKFGLTKVFFRPGKFAEFDQILKSDPENLRKLIAKVKKWILCSQWKKAQWAALSVIKLKNKIIYRRQALIAIQKYTRMHLARKQHAPRYQGILRLKKSQDQIEAIGKMASSLKPDARANVQANVKAIYSQLDAAIARIRASSKITKTEIDAMYKVIVLFTIIVFISARHNCHKL